MTSENPASNGIPAAPISAAALVSGMSDLQAPAAPPGLTWQAPLSMSWRSDDPVDRPDEDLSVSWGPIQQTLIVGKAVFVHDGPPTALASSGVARLLLAASARQSPWRPVGEPDDVRRAEFNVALVELLLDMILDSSPERMPAERLPPDHIAPQIAQSSEALAAALAPFPLSAREAVARLLLDIDEQALLRLSPLFFERRKVDRRGYDPAAVVAFKFRSDQAFEPGELQGQLHRQLASLRALASAPAPASELGAQELWLRAFGQPDQQIAIAARGEMMDRLRRFEAMGGQQATAPMEALGRMTWLAANLYYMVKPSCRICALPATHMIQVGELRDTRCDSHPLPPTSGARALPGVEVIRAGGEVARQIAMATAPGAPGSSPQLR